MSESYQSESINISAVCQEYSAGQMHRAVHFVTRTDKHPADWGTRTYIALVPSDRFLSPRKRFLAAAHCHHGQT